MSYLLFQLNQQNKNIYNKFIYFLFFHVTFILDGQSLSRIISFPIPFCVHINSTIYIWEFN